MPATSSLSWSALSAAERELAENLAGLESGAAADGESESFGLEEALSGKPNAEVWGLRIRDGLAGAAWLGAEPASGTARIFGLCLARGWRGMDLPAWMLRQLAARAKGLGCAAVSASLPKGASVLAEAFRDAGFLGPPEDAPDYPAGEWRLTGPASPSLPRGI